MTEPSRTACPVCSRDVVNGSLHNCGTKTAAEHDPTVRQLPLADILVDYGWNSRSRHDVLSAQSDGVTSDDEDGAAVKEGDGFEGLCKSLRESGLDVPVTVRAVLNERSLSGAPCKQPYELVAGFRRTTAVLAVYARKETVPGLMPGRILARVRTLDPVAARLVNIRENTDRASLPSPDLIWAVVQLQQQGVDTRELPLRLNLTPDYVRRALRIATLPAPVLEHWRGARPVRLPGIPCAINGEPVPTRALSFSTMVKLVDSTFDPAEQEKRYVTLVTEAARSKKSGASHGRGDATDTRIIEMARTVARLVDLGATLPRTLDWQTVIASELSARQRVDPLIVAKFCDLAEATFTAYRAEQQTNRLRRK